MSDPNFKIQKACWQGRVDTEDGDKGLRWHQVVKTVGPEDTVDASLVGYASDKGVVRNKGRDGAEQGPEAIRRALANFASHSLQSVVDHGDLLPQVNYDQDITTYANKICEACNQSRLVVGLGGGHDIAFGSFQGLTRFLNQTNQTDQTKQTKQIGIINFDAHFDLRKPSPNASSGTPFYQIAQWQKSAGQAFHYACLGVAKSANTHVLFECAESLNVRFLLDKDCSLDQMKATVAPMLEEVDELYVTICLDAFPAHVAPGVSAPATLGIAPENVIDMLLWLAQKSQPMNYRWRLMDVAEMNPKYDIDHRTAKLAARLIFEVVSQL